MCNTTLFPGTLSIICYFWNFVNLQNWCGHVIANAAELIYITQDDCRKSYRRWAWATIESSFSRATSSPLRFQTWTNLAGRGVCAMLCSKWVCKIFDWIPIFIWCDIISGRRAFFQRSQNSPGGHDTLFQYNVHNWHEGIKKPGNRNERHRRWVSGVIGCWSSAFWIFDRVTSEKVVHYSRGWILSHEALAEWLKSSERMVDRSRELNTILFLLVSNKHQNFDGMYNRYAFPNLWRKFKSVEKILNPWRKWSLSPRVWLFSTGLRILSFLHKKRIDNVHFI